MALSKEEKDALEAHYKNKDAYDPSKEPGQAPPSFNCGGTAQAQGYADGGDVFGIDQGDPMPYEDSEFAGPALSADTDTVKSPVSMPKNSPAPQLAELGVPQPALSAPPASPAPAGAVLAPPPASRSPLNAPSAPGGLSKAEFNQMMQYLQPNMANRVGQGALSGLAGLADAIETGVARTNGSNFQKNLEETRQKQKENLLNTLKAKYETGYKGSELAESQRHNLEGEKETRQARELTQQAQGLTAKKIEADENKTALEQAEKTGGIWNKLKGAVGLGIPGPDPAILARAQGGAGAPAAGPYGPTVQRGGKTYQWSPVSHQYHPVK